MMAARQPFSCQWTASQLASVLLPLPPFMVATVMMSAPRSRLLLKALRDKSVKCMLTAYAGQIPQFKSAFAEASRPTSLQYA